MDTVGDVNYFITEDMNRGLTKEITQLEVRKALFAMHIENEPSPDGMTNLFYQRFWHSIKDELIAMVSDF